MLVFGFAAVVEEALVGSREYVIGMHGPAALAATQYPAREFPEASPGVRGLAVVLYCCAGSVHPLSWHAGIWHGYVHPLFLGPRYPPVSFPVDTLAVGTDLRDLRANVSSGAPLPKPVVLLWVEVRGDLGRDEGLNLLEGMRSVYIVADDVAYHRRRPSRFTRGRRDARRVEHPFCREDCLALDTNHAEDAPHDGHLLLIHNQGVASIIESESVAGRAMVSHAPRYHLALADLP